MFQEVIRELADAMADPTTGVRAQLITLPIDPEDERPTDVFVVDGTRDDGVIKGEQVNRGEADLLVYVVPDGPTVTQKKNIKAEYAYGITPVRITVAHRGEGLPAEKVQDVAYVLRATVLALKAYFERREVDRHRNDVTVLRVESVAYGLVQDDGLGALGAVVFTVDALDKRAQRTV